MSVLVVAQLVSACAYVGFQWTVRLVVYPQLARVPASAFVEYERAHGRRISPLVGFLFAACVLTTTLGCIVRPDDIARWGPYASAILLAVVLATTALLAVPLHRRLGDGWDPAVHRRLLRVDDIRVAAATANVAILVAAVLSV